MERFDREAGPALPSGGILDGARARGCSHVTERSFYTLLLLIWLVLAAVTFFALLSLTAPYGRHRRQGWGPGLPARAGWLLMELPAAVVVAFFFFVSERRTESVSIVFLALWQIHYLHRSLVYPFRVRASDRRMPLAVALMAVVFNMTNGYLNGRWLFALGPTRSADWLVDPRFLMGVALFAGGFALNLHSDALLSRLRRPGESEYRVPRGAAFRLVSCPNYLGEIVEWCGWALLTWSPAGLAFALWTAANLVPRAISHHRWYRERFPDYPRERRAIVPFVL